LALSSIVINVEPIVKLSVILRQSVFDKFLKLIWCLLFTHLQFHSLNQPVDIFLLKFFDIWDNHEVQKVDEYIGTLSQNLEGFAAFYLEVREGFILNF